MLWWIWLCVLCFYSGSCPWIPITSHYIVSDPYFYHHSLVEFQEILLLFFLFLKKKNPCSFKLQSSDSSLSKEFVLLSHIAFVSVLSQHFCAGKLILSCSLISLCWIIDFFWTSSCMHFYVFQIILIPCKCIECLYSYTWSWIICVVRLLPARLV